MVSYRRIDVSEDFGVNKMSASNKWIFCHYFYLLDKGFKFKFDLNLTVAVVMMF